MTIIQTQRSTLLFSIYRSENGFVNIKPLLENLDLGYKFQFVKQTEYAVIFETILSAEVVN